MPPRHAASVRKRLTILRDGTTESCELVFCEAERRSVPVSSCEACAFAGLKSRETARHDVVDCGRSILPIVGSTSHVGFAPAAAAALPVGLALVRPVVCVEEEVPLGEAAGIPALLASPYGVAVVGRGGVLLGMLPPAALVSGGPGWKLDCLAPVVDYAVSAVAVHEKESLGEAFTKMGARRAREVTVVGDGLRVVGLLRDVDAMHFVACVARTGTRPERDHFAGV